MCAIKIPTPRIISASRRCDMPAHETDRLMRILDDGCVTLPGFTAKSGVTVPCRTIPVTPDTTDGIVLWTKDIRRMAANDCAMLRRIFDPVTKTGIPFYIQHTLTPYNKTIEPRVLDKPSIVTAMNDVIRVFGVDALVWRYDPIFISDTCTVDAHIASFASLASQLNIDTCVISFIDIYPKLKSRLDALGIRDATDTEKHQLLAAFSRIAKAHGFRICTCAEHIDASVYNIEHARCIDADRLSTIAGKTMCHVKDPRQREACGCARSIDIGAYNTCKHGCVYCYANNA